MAMETRHVCYSVEQGVFLGNRRWSKRNPEGQATAPTFLDMKAAEAAVDGEAVSWRLIQVWPDCSENRASMEACANAQLPRWNLI